MGYNARLHIHRQPFHHSKGKNRPKMDLVKTKKGTRRTNLNPTPPLTTTSLSLTHNPPIHNHRLRPPPIQFSKLIHSNCLPDISVLFYILVVLVRRIEVRAQLCDSPGFGGGHRRDVRGGPARMHGGGGRGCWWGEAELGALR